MLWNILLYGNGIVSIVLTVFFLFALRKNTIGKWEKLPRERWSGSILGFLALLAFIPNVEPMFSVEKNLGILISGAIILAVLCFLYADHIFSRAVAGILILNSHAALAESFASRTPGSSFFAVMMLFWGSCGIVLAAKPYLLRDLMRKCAANICWKGGTVFCLLMWFSASLLMLVNGVWNKNI